jgi:hypothetical protein
LVNLLTKGTFFLYSVRCERFLISMPEIKLLCLMQYYQLIAYPICMCVCHCKTFQHYRFYNQMNSFFICRITQTFACKCPVSTWPSCVKTCDKRRHDEKLKIVVLYFEDDTEKKNSIMKQKKTIKLTLYLTKTFLFRKKNSFLNTT